MWYRTRARTSPRSLTSLVYASLESQVKRLAGLLPELVIRNRCPPGLTGLESYFSRSHFQTQMPPLWQCCRSWSLSLRTLGGEGLSRLAYQSGGVLFLYRAPPAD